MKKNFNGGSKKDELDIAPYTREQLRRGVMGKYSRPSRNGRGLVTEVALEEDVAAVFKDSKSVNDVLRAIIKSLPPENVRKRRKSA
jgi:hypothetical protein